MKTYISSKPYKAWCKARGIDFVSHMQLYPLIAKRLTMPKTISPIFDSKRLSLWQRIVRFIKKFFTY